MNEVTLTALEESIAKWEKRATGTPDARLGTSHCPLCKLFHNDYREPEDEDDYGKNCCLGCPVFERTGEQYCWNTPYIAYSQADGRTNENAQREADFLKSLLPAEETKKKTKPDFGWVDLDYLK